MAIISTTVEVDPVTQPNGSRYVTEVHTLTGGGVERINYLAAADVNPLADALSRAANVLIRLKNEEAQENVMRDGPLVLNHMTGAEFATWLRTKFKAASKSDQAYVCWWLLRRISSGDVTDTVARNAFGLTVTQWNNLKANTIQPRADAWTAVLAASRI